MEGLKDWWCVYWLNEPVGYFRAKEDAEDFIERHADAIDKRFGGYKLEQI
jgi:hypothetical protein